MAMFCQPARSGSWQTPATNDKYKFNSRWNDIKIASLAILETTFLKGQNRCHGITHSHFTLSNVFYAELPEVYVSFNSHCNALVCHIVK